jgi:hypothetical protein
MQTQDLQDLADRANAAIGDEATIFDNDARGRAVRRLINLQEDLFWTVQMGEDEVAVAQAQDFLRAECWEIIDEFEI